MASTRHETSLDMNELCSRITAINERNPGNSSLTLGCGISTTTSDIQMSINIEMQKPRLQPATSPQNLGKAILSLTLEEILGLFISLLNSFPPLPTVLLRAARLISFAVSFAAVFLQNAFPSIAPLLKKLSALFAAIGVCTISSLLVHQNQNHVWICWLACGSCLLAFFNSFK